MGSLEAMENGSKTVTQGGTTRCGRNWFGKSIAARVPYKGSLCDSTYQLVGGLRAGMGYCGAHIIAELHNARFTPVSLMQVY